MTGLAFVRKRTGSALRIVWAFCLLALPGAPLAAASTGDLPMVAKWGRFERSFKSTRLYDNAPRQATLIVVFTSPLGETRQVEGFWDGGKTWRVRFSPDLPGRWTYETMCTDGSNQGLDNHSGAFLCTAPLGPSRFEQHGPVRLARDHRHFEHADRTPFFWLADTAWNGALASDPKDWAGYAGVRAAQKFTAVQWSALPGRDLKDETAFSARDPSLLNPDYFRRLDGKIDTLNHAGLLSVIAPLGAIGGHAGSNLAEDDAILLLRYMMARWGANDVAWLLGPPVPSAGSAPEAALAPWKRIGAAVIGAGPHSPVILFAGENPAVLDDFRLESWVDGFGCESAQTGEGLLLHWLRSGPVTDLWRENPTRPLLNLAPPLERNPVPTASGRITAEDVRRELYWSLLLTRPAGVSYGAVGVADWSTAVDRQPGGSRGGYLPAWQDSLFLPGAKQMSVLADVFGSIECWRLEPAPQLLAEQPGNISPQRYVAAAFTGKGDAGLVYIPEDRTLDLRLDALPPSPVISWINPRTGEKSPAVAVVSGSTCQFPTPAAGDWLLLITAGR